MTVATGTLDEDVIAGKETENCTCASFNACSLAAAFRWERCPPADCSFAACTP
jgi:hypothetical protein